jgi:hypothetical protein
MPFLITAQEDNPEHPCKMISTDHQVLKRFFELYSSNPSLAHLREKLTQIPSSDFAPNDIDDIIAIYHATIPLVEEEIWSAGPNDTLIRQYQQLFQELEALYTLHGNDTRHKFVIVIPVADRPRHLQSCLASLLTLCQSFNYGGFTEQRFPKLAVIIADDTKDHTKILQNKEIARYFNAQGIETIYFGLDEQQELLARLAKDERRQLLNILGDFDRSAFYHKGPSIMRNITYLKLNELANTEENLLFFFVDSDQEFQVKVQADGEDKELYAINYFYQLDRIFSRHDVNILTGKVVGDPPVSPAVMAGTFLDDINSFLHQMAATEHHLPCQFHHQPQYNKDDAAYHDMADLFGFQPASTAYQYRCSLKGEHDHAKCLTDFATKLNQFFHGEHPTRKSYFNQGEPVANIKPARTIYTGNYIFNPDGLKYFIPYARLKLRMAGPVLGRIIKAESNDRFVSANLPMLHKRTVEEIGESEYRPGINSEQNKIDLSGEFERQFFGDVMLFTMEKLTTIGFPSKSVSQQVIIQTLEETAQDMRLRYATKQKEILEKLTRLKSLFNDKNNWWNTASGMALAIKNITCFINNIENNFGPASPSYELIDSEANRNLRFKQMLEAINQYPADRQTWTHILEVQRERQRIGFRDKARR